MGVTAAVAAVASTAYSIYNGERQKSMQEGVQEEARRNAQKQQSDADMAANRANQKKPDTMAILDSALQAGKGGASGTMLTGPSGVDPNALALGKSTLLGQ